MSQPEIINRAAEDLERVYPDVEIITCRHCGQPWGIRLQKRGEDDPLSAISCGNRECGEMFSN